MFSHAAKVGKICEPRKRLRGFFCVPLMEVSGNLATFAPRKSNE
jgi:hypothetical protein